MTLYSEIWGESEKPGKIMDNDSPYFRCPDEERFYPFDILAFRTLKILLLCVVVLALHEKK